LPAFAATPPLWLSLRRLIASLRLSPLLMHYAFIMAAADCHYADSHAFLIFHFEPFSARRFAIDGRQLPPHCHCHAIDFVLMPLREL